MTVTGRIGPLRVDSSDRAAVIAFAGRPEAEKHGEYTPDYGPYDALGYRCDRRRATYGNGMPACATVFFIRARTGKLEEFYTADPGYVGPHGVRPGISGKRAERLLHRRVPRVGCLSDLTYDGRGASLTIVFAGRSSPGRVGYFVLVSRRHAAGVFDCIDS